MDILKMLEREFNLQPFQVENTVKLIDEEHTIPFIARYRKELTGALDDQVLRELHVRLEYLRNLEQRREQIRSSIAAQEKLTDKISSELDKAQTLTEIEDIYLPFKPKRRTRATIAKERGLENLAMLIWAQKLDKPAIVYAEDFINEEKGVPTAADALNGAKDIMAEMIADDAKFRNVVRQRIHDEGFVQIKACDPSKESVYEMYYDFSEPVKKIAAHRILAVNRGEKEGILNVKIEVDTEEIVKRIYNLLVKVNIHTKEILQSTIEDSYKRLLFPSIEREIRSGLTEKAEEGAIKVFGENLRQLLLQAPIKEKTVLALDPGFRTGCKVAVVDEIGNVLATDVVYATPPLSKIKESKEKLKKLIEKFGVNLIAIGNGTASRETESFTADLIKENNYSIYYAIVNEAGASVYSASKLGAAEFPEYDVALRSAVSIGRRLQDPLAELVKIDPKSIGVGQYQHDMNQKKLGETLGGVVESCVNSVGVDLNTASAPLLSYVAGISGTLATNIVEYRKEKGKFTSRKELQKVKKLGPKAFEQCAGFLRIAESDNPLDNTGVHPESYNVAQALLKKIGCTTNQIDTKKIKTLQSETIKNFANELQVGLLTLQDIIKELEKPGRDPREDMPAQILRSDVLSIEDLQEGMILNGTVRNVIDFGVFVDIGVHHDGLVHISQIANKFIKHPLDALSVGDIVKVKVIGIDLPKKRISLSIRDANDAE